MSNKDILFEIIKLFICVGVYGLPSFIAIIKSHKKSQYIVPINIAFGWTIIGWLIPLYWSLKKGNKS